MSSKICYEGDKDCSLEVNFLCLTLRKDYFYEMESDCFCIPLSIYCTDVTGDVIQDFIFQDSVNDLKVSLCYEIKQSCNAILYISRSEWNYNSHSKKVVVKSGGKICGQEYAGEIIFEVTKLQAICEEINRSRAMRCYENLEFRFLWEKWCNNSYVLEIDLFDIIKSRVRKMNSVYNDEFGHQRFFLWSENGYKIEHSYTRPTISLDGIVQCISPVITDVLKEEPEVVCSVIVSYSEEHLDSSNDISTIEAWRSIRKKSDTTRFLIHGLDDYLDYQDIHDIKYLEFSINDEGIVIILLDNWDDIETGECPFCNSDCSPL